MTARAAALREAWLWRYVTTPTEPDDPNWHDRAECRGLDVALFFPDADAANNTSAYQACATCPVRLECLHEAFRLESDMSLHYIDGVRGGLSAYARRKFLRDHPEIRTTEVAA